MVTRVSEPGVSLSKQHVRISERSEKGVGRTSHPKWRCHACVSHQGPEEAHVWALGKGRGPFVGT